MIIDTYGNVYQAWFRKNGMLIEDDDNQYGIHFAIVIPYTEEQRSIFQEIMGLKNYLKNTDYQAIKYSEGAISEEKFAPIKTKRAEARARINEIEFEEPTLTREEIDEAERLVMEKLKE